MFIYLNYISIQDATKAFVNFIALILVFLLTGLKYFGDVKIFIQKLFSKKKFQKKIKFFFEKSFSKIF